MGKYVEFSPGFCIGAALMLMILPLRWILALTAAAVFHELCHMTVLKFCGIRIFGLRIGMGGAEISTEPMIPWQELLCALAGPAGSLALLLFVHAVPLTALFGLIQGLYNLIPVMPLDGGRAMNSILALLCPARADAVMMFLRRVVIIVLVMAGFSAAFVPELGFVLPVVLLLMAVKLLPVKIPCKEAGKGVQ